MAELLHKEQYFSRSKLHRPVEFLLLKWKESETLENRFKTVGVSGDGGMSIRYKISTEIIK